MACSFHGSTEKMGDYFCLGNFFQSRDFSHPCPWEKDEQFGFLFQEFPETNLAEKKSHTKNSRYWTGRTGLGHGFRPKRP